MCHVLCRHYECGHWFHEVDRLKRCDKFNKILDNARKNSDLAAYKCENHGKKDPLCEAVKPILGKETTMIHIDDIRGPWSVARRNVVGGHCDNVKWVAGNDPGGPMKKKTLTGWCRECDEKLKVKLAKEAVAKREKSLLRLFWK